MISKLYCICISKFYHPRLKLDRPIIRVQWGTASLGPLENSAAFLCCLPRPMPWLYKVILRNCAWFTTLFPYCCFLFFVRNRVFLSFPPFWCRNACRFLGKRYFSFWWRRFGGCCRIGSLWDGIRLPRLRRRIAVVNRWCNLCFRPWWPSGRRTGRGWWRGGVRFGEKSKLVAGVISYTVKPVTSRYVPWHTT